MYPPPKIKIQNIKSGKITETTTVAVDVMKKHGLFKDFVILNENEVPKSEEITPISVSKKKGRPRIEPNPTAIQNVDVILEPINEEPTSDNE